MNRHFMSGLTLHRMFENSRHLPEQLALAGSSSRSGHNRGTAVEADAIGEQQTKRTPSGSRVDNRGAAAEVDKIGKQLASGKQQLKRMQAGSSAAVETDRCNRAGIQQQLKRMQSGSSSSVQRAIQHRTTHVGERGGSS